MRTQHTLPITFQAVTLAELPAAELCRPSGTVGALTGQPVSRFQDIQQQEALSHGGQVFLNRGSLLSEEARQTNTDITRDPGLTPDQRRGRCIVAVVARRAPEPTA